MPIGRSGRRGMIAGAAIASSRGKKRAAAAQVPQSTAAPVASTDTDIEQLKKLAELKDQGILTQEEFDAKKKQILGL